ncbi:hypothetical protein Tco_1456819 [Tanacetum coccineum]
MEAFIGGMPQSIEGNVTASKPQTLEEAFNIAQRLMDQILKRNSVQETDDHKRKFEDKRNTNKNDNNYPNNRNNNKYPNNHNNNNHSNNRNNHNYQDNRNNNNRNNDHHQQQNGRQETFKANGNRRYNGPHPLCRKLRDEADFFQVDILSARADNGVLPYRRLSFDILLPLIRFHYTVKVIEQLMAWSGMDLKMAKTCTVMFGNDQIALNLSYGDLVQGHITIKRVYYVEGLNHNLFSIGQFCDADLDVAFRNSTCYIRDLKGNDLLT